MERNYYIQTELVIEYLDKMGRLSFIYTNRSVNRGYIYQPPDYDSDDDEETSYKKYQNELERKIKENTYNKVLFENNAWIKDSYRKKYEERFKREFKDVDNVKKIYKKVTAWERN